MSAENDKDTTHDEKTPDVEYDLKSEETFADRNADAQDRTEMHLASGLDAINMDGLAAFDNIVVEWGPQTRMQLFQTSCCLCCYSSILRGFYRVCIIA